MININALLYIFMFSVTTLGLRNAEEETAPFAYDDYGSVLKTHVNDHGMVDYKGLKEDRKRLKVFLDRIGQLEESQYKAWSDQEKIAFLINAYNALTLKAVIDHYPIRKTINETPSKSVRQIKGVWDKLTFKVMGRMVTLNQIEHEMLRAKFNEPRIHMALVCAALSCPTLRNEPFFPDRLHNQLEDQTRRFLRSSEKFRIDRENEKVYLSQIFRWFGEDFVKTYGTEDRFKTRGKTERAVLSFIGRYLGEKDSYFLEQGEYEIIYLDYDWSLNEQNQRAS